MFSSRFLRFAKQVGSQTRNGASDLLWFLGMATTPSVTGVTEMKLKNQVPARKLRNPFFIAAATAGLTLLCTIGISGCSENRQANPEIPPNAVKECSETVDEKQQAIKDFAAELRRRDEVQKQELRRYLADAKKLFPSTAERSRRIQYVRLQVKRYEEKNGHAFTEFYVDGEKAH